MGKYNLWNGVVGITSIALAIIAIINIEYRIYAGIAAVVLILVVIVWRNYVEFIVIVTELIMIQEKTNYPTGNLNVKVFERFRDKHDDIFAVVSAATFR